MNYKSLSVCLLFVTVSLSACGISLKPTMPVPVIPPISSGESNVASENKMGDYYISIEPIKDSRESNIFVESNGKITLPHGDILAPIQASLVSAFKTKRFIVSDSATLVIMPELKKWRGDSSSSSFAEAEISLQVFDPSNKPIYKGTYRGSAMLSGMIANEKEISESLGLAMSEVIKQIVLDQKLIKLLSSF
jgi:hypothetical protein